MALQCSIVNWGREISISVSEVFEDKPEILLRIKHVDNLDDAFEYAREQFQASCSSIGVEDEVGDQQTKICHKCDLYATRFCATVFEDVTKCPLWRYFNKEMLADEV